MDNDEYWVSATLYRIDGVIGCTQAEMGSNLEGPFLIIFVWPDYMKRSRSTYVHFGIYLRPYMKEVRHEFG